MKHPAAVTACNVDLENLITDSNRSIATLAITTLLKVTMCVCVCGLSLYNLHTDNTHNDVFSAGCPMVTTLDLTFASYLAVSEISRIIGIFFASTGGVSLLMYYFG